MMRVALFIPENTMSDNVDNGSELVKPEIPGGFNDYSPEQTLARKWMFARIEETLRLFAFVPLQTSIVQRREVLTGGKPIENRLYDLTINLDEVLAGAMPGATKSQKDRFDAFLLGKKDRITLRFDLTVTLARYVAEHMKDLVFPFRRYECSDVARGESSQEGRFNLFGQFDADIVGAEVGMADAEIIRCMASVMKNLGIERFMIKVNDRKVLNGLAERVGFPLGSKAAAALLRTMDKVDKIGVDGVINELCSKTAPEGEEEAFSFDDARCNLVRGFMSLVDGLTTNTDRLAALSAYFAGEGIGAEGVRELELIASLLAASGMPEDKWIIDPSVARGLGYYTGPVFETSLLDEPTFGSVYSGGRYDDLVARFTGKSLPCVGASVGVDRLFAALEKIAKRTGIKRTDESSVDVYIVTMDPALVPEYFGMASELRDNRISTEINMGYQDSSLRGQMATARARRARVMLFYGPDNVAAGTVGVKNTTTREQVDVPRGELVSAVLTALGRSS